MSDFSRIFGNEDTKKRLSAAIRSNTLPHAFIICGPRGSGKRTLAVEIARAVNCSGSSLPCGFCATCRRIKEENFTDVKYLRRSGAKATIGVEELRDFKNDMFLSPTESAFKFYIIEEADLLTPSAQNALLKVLEEPPFGVHILLLCTSPDKILTTVKSRAQLIQTELFSPSEMESHLISLSDDAERLHQTDPKKLKSIILSAAGVIGAALELFDEKKISENEQTRKNILDIISVLPKRTPFSALYKVMSVLPQKREEVRKIFELVITALRDFIVHGESPNCELLFFLSGEDLESKASLDAKRAAQLCALFSDAISDLDKNAVVSLLIQDLTFKIQNT